MDKNKLTDLLLNDQQYREIVREADEWIADFKQRPDDEKPSSGAEYIKRVVGVMEACRVMLSGSDQTAWPEPGCEYNRSALEVFKETLLTCTYKIALINRAVHRVVNPELIPVMDRQSELDEVIERMIEDGSADWLDREFVPAYLIELRVIFK